ncbi:hypothetical protein L208DRAFT_1426887 [Tricholoma matsutake]|nr:hypothetical protein L208DRAFT_1426887 [Tricholoma matsutake 945]
MFFNTIGHSMTWAQHPKWSPTPTSATFPADALPPSLTPPPPPKLLYLCSPFVEAALIKRNFKTIMMLPKYIDIIEWVAVNIFNFYMNLNKFYNVIAECCTQQNCPTMVAGPTYICPAAYIDYIMTWVQNLHDDKNMFTTKSGHQFPQSFPSMAKHIYWQLLRIFAHIYHAHYPQILHLQSKPHFNSIFAHFLSFGQEYGLLEVKDVKGSSSAQVGVRQLWEKWKEMRILEG